MSLARQLRTLDAEPERDATRRGGARQNDETADVLLRELADREAHLQRARHRPLRRCPDRTGTADDTHRPAAGTAPGGGGGAGASRSRARPAKAERDRRRVREQERLIGTGQIDPAAAFL